MISASRTTVRVTQAFLQFHAPAVAVHQDCTAFYDQIADHRPDFLVRSLRRGADFMVLCPLGAVNQIFAGCG